jgi:hypothetical protein
LYKKASWSQKSINITDLVAALNGQLELLLCQRVDTFYDFSLSNVDQTLNIATEAAIEVIFKVAV